MKSNYSWKDQLPTSSKNAENACSWHLLVQYLFWPQHMTPVCVPVCMCACVHVHMCVPNAVNTMPWKPMGLIHTLIILNIMNDLMHIYTHVRAHTPIPLSPRHTSPSYQEGPWEEICPFANISGGNRWCSQPGNTWGGMFTKLWLGNQWSVPQSTVTTERVSFPSMKEQRDWELIGIQREALWKESPACLWLWPLLEGYGQPMMTQKGGYGRK